MKTAIDFLNTVASQPVFTQVILGLLILFCVVILVYLCILILWVCLAGLVLGAVKDNPITTWVLHRKYKKLAKESKNVVARNKENTGITSFSD